MLNCRKLIHSIIHMPDGNYVSQIKHNETIREVFSKARDMDSISMPLLLQEGYNSYELEKFTEALYLTIESVQRSTDIGLKVIRLTAEA